MAKKLKRIIRQLTPKERGRLEQIRAAAERNFPPATNRKTIDYQPSSLPAVTGVEIVPLKGTRPKHVHER